MQALRCKNSAGFGLGLVLLTFAAYLFTIPASFKTLDDDYSIVYNENIRHFSRIGRIFTTSFFEDNGYYRPLVSLTYMLEYHLFGLNPVGFYLVNILIHAAAALLVFGLMRRLLVREMPAFFTAAVFAVHPVHWEAIANISGRAILLSAFFSLAVFYLFCRGGKKDYLLALALFPPALLSKESAAILPLVLLAYRFFLVKKADEKFPGWAGPAAPFFLMNAGYVLLRQALGITKVYAWRNVTDALLGFLTFLRGVITYLRLLVLPVDLHFDRSRGLFTSLFQGELLLTVLFFSILLVLLIEFRKYLSPAVRFFLVWSAVELIPVCQIIFTITVRPGYISLAEHFLYLPVVGLIAAAVLGLEAFYKKNRQSGFISARALAAAGAVFFIFLFLMTIQHNIYARSEIAMFERSLKFNPGNVRIRNSLALFYAKLKRFEEAQRHFQEVLNFDPSNVKARIGVGKTLADQGKLWESILEYEKIKDAGEMSGILADNRRLTFAALIEQYRQALKRDPGDARLHYSLGVVYSKQPNPAEAIRHLNQAVALKPDFKEALFNLGALYAIAGDLRQAAAHYERVLALPGPPHDLDQQACMHLGQVYSELGEPEKGRACPHKPGEPGAAPAAGIPTAERNS